MSANREIFLKKQDFSSLSSNIKSNYYAKDLKSTHVNFLDTDIGFTKMEIKPSYKTLLYCVDFIIEINESFNQILAKLSWVLDKWDLLELKLGNHRIFFHISYNHWRIDYWDRSSFWLYIRTLIDIMALFVMKIIFNLAWVFVTIFFDKDSIIVDGWRVEGLALLAFAI